jgi:hypothetical protein
MIRQSGLARSVFLNSKVEKCKFRHTFIDKCRYENTPFIDCEFLKCEYWSEKDKEVVDFYPPGSEPPAAK